MADFFHFQKCVPLPIEFINKYMINANATYVKVYLYGLALCYESKENVTNADIAEALDILETDVSKAWRYWKRVGLIKSEGKGAIMYNAIPCEETLPEAKKKEEPEAKKEQTEETRKRAANMEEITKAMEINPKMRDTVKMAEQLLKKTLSSREVEAIYNFMQWYGMSEAVVLELFEYCATIDKTSISYIEKVAQNWYDNGITTVEAATKVLNKAVKIIRMQNKCKKMFGLDRAFSAGEAKYISSWVSEYTMSEAMIKAAYERTVLNTGKLSMPYMNSILRSWYEKDIKTVSQIEQKGDYKSPKKAKDTSYELDEMAALERKLRLAKQKG